MVILSSSYKSSYELYFAGLSELIIIAVIIRIGVTNKKGTEI